MELAEITFHEIPHSRPIKQFVKSNLKRWAKAHAPEAFTKVEFFRAPFDNMVGCYIEAHHEGLSWRRMEYGKGIHNAFLLCLKHLNLKGGNRITA